jgi:hypothetical protein
MRSSLVDFNDDDDRCLCTIWRWLGVSQQATGTAAAAGSRPDRAHIPPLWHRGCW